MWFWKNGLTAFQQGWSLPNRTVGSICIVISFEINLAVAADIMSIWSCDF